MGNLHKLHLDILEDIPPQVFSCTLITSLYLKQNQISEIPAEIVKLENLKVRPY